MKKLCYVLMAALMLVGCDKIEDMNGNYVVYSGASGEWFEGTTLEDHSQRVFIEKYTGLHCVNCPKADTVLDRLHDQYGDMLITLSVYDSNTLARPFAGNEDLRTSYGETWSDYFGTAYLPCCMLNRSRNGDKYEVLAVNAALSSKIDALLAQSAPLAVEVRNAGIADGKVDADVYLEFLQDISDELTITLLVMEDGVVSEQELPQGTDPNYIHNHVLRQVITDVWGEQLKVESSTGKCYRARYTFEANSKWNISNCHVVAFVSNKENRTILNSGECKLSE